MKFSQRTQGMNSSVVRETLKIMEQPGIISFAGGMPSPDVFPVEDLRASMDRVMRSRGPAALQYGTTEGYPPLREKIAARHRTEGVSCTAEDILLISGSQQGLDLAGKIFLDPGDLVVCENPTYMAALSAFRSYECGFLPVKTDAEGMLLEDLEQKLAGNPRVKLIYVIPTFQNPTGRVWSLERRRGLLALAEKYGVPILEDNPYGELRYEGDPLPSLKALDKSGLVIYLGTFSKILSPGIRLGWIVAGKEPLAKLNAAKQLADLQANTAMQMAVDAYLEDCDLEENLRKLKAVYRARRDRMLELLGREFPAGASWEPPQGGLFIWVRLPGEMDAAELLPEAVAQRVAYIPGVSFFAFSDVKNALRLNFSNAAEPQIAAGMRRLGTLFRNHI